MASTKSPVVLVVEDDAALQKQLRWSLHGFESAGAADRPAALALFRRLRPPVVTMDLGLPPAADGTAEGFALLEQLLAIDPTVKVIVLTGQDDRRHALRAVELGAYDFLAKPFDPEALTAIVRRALQLYELQAENQRLREQQLPDPHHGPITRDPEMLRVCRTIERVAPTSTSVLLQGESGTGKEVLARLLHQASGRKGRLVAINCAAIPEPLLESELFGYERGAFTGADRRREGLVQSADGGTLLLDEVGDLPIGLQAKLLRFLQERKIDRLGSRESVSVDVRVICATHRDLPQAIADGRFRQDLYYRIAEIVVQIPPLRQRMGDPVLLAQAFLHQVTREQKLGSMSFEDSALAAIETHSWPGNVRELINVVRRAAIMSDHPRIGASTLGLATAAASDEPELTRLDLREVRDRAEREAVVNAMARSGGNVAKAAEMLGISRPTLYDLFKRLGIPQGRSDTDD